MSQLQSQCHLKWLVWSLFCSLLLSFRFIHLAYDHKDNLPIEAI